MNDNNLKGVLRQDDELNIQHFIFIEVDEKERLWNVWEEEKRTSPSIHAYFESDLSITFNGPASTLTLWNDGMKNFITIKLPRTGNYFREISFD